jgi:hypothetical protein
MQSAAEGSFIDIKSTAPYDAPDLIALMAELVDALVSGTSDESRGGSSPLQGTIKKPKGR